MKLKFAEMKLSRRPRMWCVTLLLCLSVAATSSSLSVQRLLRSGWSAALAYLRAEEGRGLEDLVSRVFLELPQHLPYDSAPARVTDRRLPFGYFCWSRGTMHGLRTVQKIGKVTVLEDSPLVISIPVNFTGLVYDYERCAYRNILFAKRAKCRVTFLDHEIVVTLAIEDFKTLQNLVSGVWNKQCVFKVVDAEFTALDLKVDIKNRDSSDAPLSESVFHVISKVIRAEIRSRVTRRLRVSLFTRLPASGAAFCRHHVLDQLVHRLYEDYLRRPLLPPSAPFLKLCSDDKIYNKHTF